MIRFPAVLFPPSQWAWRLDGAPLMGGQPISGPPQTADNSGGGWWACDWSPAQLAGGLQNGIFRAILGQLNSGVALIEVPVLDSNQPWPAGQSAPAFSEFTDGSEFSDGSELVTNPIVAQLAAQAYMPAFPAPAVAPTQAQIQLIAGAALQGFEYFSIIGHSGFVHLHLINQVLAVAGSTYTVSFTPPMREDAAAGTAIDFNAPRCTMKVDVASVKNAWPKLSGGLVARPTISFLESAFPIPPD